MSRRPFSPSLPLIRARIAPLGGLRGGAPAGRWRDVLLLVDTGAGNSCIVNTIAIDLGPDLLRRDLRRDVVTTPGGVAQLGFYMADIGIMPTNGTTFQRHGALVAGSLGQSPEYHGLPGRDLLAHYHFEMTRRARFRLRSWRVTFEMEDGDVFNLDMEDCH